MTTEITINYQHFILHSSGVLHWREEESLIISDVHLGKIMHFRKHGSAIPSRAVAENYHRLDEVIRIFNPSRIIFLGDLFHSAINSEWRIFSKWRKRQEAKIVLVEGNHDIIAPHFYEELEVEVLPEMSIENFFLTHKPEKKEGAFNLCGHLHPGIKIKGSARQFLKVPCFYSTKDRMILPAFGAFTGKYIMKPEPGDEVYILTDEEVIPFKF